MKKLTALSFIIMAGSVALFGVTAAKRLAAQDNQGPRITMDSDTVTISINDSEKKLLDGVTASDNRDGDVTDTIVVESVSSFLSDKTRVVTYAAFDSSNNVTKATRTMKYSDYTAIRLSMSEPLRFPVTTNGNTNLLAHIGAWDCIEGDISEKVSVSMGEDFQYDVAGDYPVTITVSNTMGDKETFPMTVTMYDQQAASKQPSIALSDELVYVKKGSTVDLLDYLTSVTIHGKTYKMTEGYGTYDTDTSEMDNEELKAFNELDPTISYSDVDVDGEPDVDTPGVYEVTYSIRDDEGNRGSVRMVIVVEEA